MENKAVLWKALSKRHEVRLGWDAVKGNLARALTKVHGLQTKSLL